MSFAAVLFVGNLSNFANAQYLERLFSAYGTVVDVKIIGEAGPSRYAQVYFNAVDDADTAIAALHFRYCSAKNLPMIVLFDKSSPAKSEYGRKVGLEFAAAIREGRDPEPIFLDAFDPCFERNDVPEPPQDATMIS